MKSFREHLKEQYGEIGTKSRNTYEAGFEAFKLGLKLEELRTEIGLTQEELAKKCGLPTSSIANIENNSSNSSLQTIIEIFKQGFGKNLKLILN